jgi:hypothetical protein
MNNKGKKKIYKYIYKKKELQRAALPLLPCEDKINRHHL